MTQPPEPDAQLTVELRTVVGLVAKGLTDRQIASRLEVSESTVQRRIREAGNALGVRTRVELAVRAVALGLIDPLQDRYP